MSLVYAGDAWIRFLTEICGEIAQERLAEPEAVDLARKQIAVLAEFCRNKLSGLLDPDGNVDPLSMDSPYDIVGWIRGAEGRPLDAYACATPIHYSFIYTDEHLKARTDYFKRYGTDINAISKIVTRVSNIQSLFRNVQTAEGEQIIYADVDSDRLTRYMLAH
jgi:hypothetical protein